MTQSRCSDPANLLRALAIHRDGHSGKALRNFSIDVPRCLDLAAFERWLFTLLWERAVTDDEGPKQLDQITDIMRVKGILYASSSQHIPHLYTLQAVEQMYDLTQLVSNSSSLRCCLIFIGTAYMS
jgi:G3E family GTPase